MVLFVRINTSSVKARNINIINIIIWIKVDFPDSQNKNKNKKSKLNFLRERLKNGFCESVCANKWNKNRNFILLYIKYINYNVTVFTSSSTFWFFNQRIYTWNTNTHIFFFELDANYKVSERWMLKYTATLLLYSFRLIRNFCGRQESRSLFFRWRHFLHYFIHYSCQSFQFPADPIEVLHFSSLCLFRAIS